MSAIVEFLNGDGLDAAGRSIDAVLAFGLGDLERHHDFIQWLFPLDEPSGAVLGSPVLTRADIEAVQHSPKAQAHLATAADHMTRFYNLTDHWLRAADHNHLRITRIIKSLRLLAGNSAAERFYNQILARVDAARAPVSETSRRYWAQA